MDRCYRWDFYAAYGRFSEGHAPADDVRQSILCAPSGLEHSRNCDERQSCRCP